MPHFCGLTLICTDSCDACSLSAIHFIQSMLHSGMLTSISSLSPTFPFLSFVLLCYLALSNPRLPISPSLSAPLLFLSTGISLPLLHHACLRLPLPLVSWPCWGLVPCPLGCPETRKANPTPASTCGSIAPSPQQCFSLPLPPSPATLPSSPSPHLPLTEREGRRRRWWRPLHPHSTAPSPPHDSAQHAAWPQHRRRPGGQLK